MPLPDDLDERRRWWRETLEDANERHPGDPRGVGRAVLTAMRDAGMLIEADVQAIEREGLFERPVAAA